MEKGLANCAAIIELGAVINGDGPDRTSSDEITAFDGTGVAFQGLAVASRVAESCLAKGLATEIPF